MTGPNVAGPGSQRRCLDCGCIQATDNETTRCSPCRARRRRERLDRSELRAAWTNGGFPGLAAAASTTPADTAALALLLEVVPASSKLTETRLLALAVERRTPSTVLARRWRVSRWTVAGWRSWSQLPRLTGPTPGTARSAAPLLVEGVRVSRRDGKVRVDGPDGPVRLGRSARALVGELVEAHPMGVSAEELARRLFPASEPAAAKAALQVTVSRLRRHLPAGAIRYRDAGYQLDIPVSAIDV